MACIEFCLLSLHKQKDYNLKGNYVFISAMCIETLVQSRTFVCFRTNTNGNNVGWGGNDVQRLQLWIHCMEMEWNLFIAEISQFNLHFNAFSPALIICRLFSKLFHRFRLFHSLSVPCFRRQIIAMTGQSQWWIPIFLSLLVSDQTNDERADIQTNTSDRAEIHSVWLNPVSIDTSARRKKHIALYSFATLALDSWAQIKSKQMTSYFFCHIFLLFRFVAAAAAATTTVACITKTVSPIQRLL